MMTKIRSTLAIAALSVSAALGLATAFSAPVEAQRTLGSLPTGAALVDFRVLGADGRPVTDIKAEEVKVSVDGRERVVQSVRLVEVAAGAAAPEPALPPPFATNVVPEGQRHVMILFNDASIRAGQEPDVKAAISRFVSTLGPSDQVGLMTTPRGAVRVEPTTDRAAFEAGLARVVGQAAPMESAEDFRCRTREVLDELRGMFGGLTGRTSPTYVLFFSAGLAESSTAAARIGADTSSACELRPDSFQNLAFAASSARVQMYVLQPEGLTSPRPGDEGLESLAGVTGSRRYRIGSSGQSVLDQIATETAAYYLATVGLEDVERTGAPHRLEVTVARAGVRTVHHTELMLGAPPAAGGKAPEAPTPRDMLRTAEAFGGLPLRVGGFSTRNEAGDSKLKVIGILQPIESVSLTAVSAGLVNSEGRLVAQWTAQPEELKEVVFAALLVDPGTYRLRMAATDSAGRAGAADYTLNVGLHQVDTVQVSEAATFSAATGSYMPVLEYAPDDTAIVLFELYGQPPQGFFAQAELAKTPDGPMIQNPQLQAAPGGEGFLRIVGQFPLADLEPGDYVARITLGKEPQVKLIRTIRKRQ
jgi:hypothetical protein